ncbi:uncharacterized protein [Aegilops tauschii subsp. strangulata]|uniref:uncharacterized protein n=1 Tax=Aegilops tauschii subsp. strangulata TaxID=200361 RepID=UPI003CC8AAF5
MYLRCAVHDRPNNGANGSPPWNSGTIRHTILLYNSSPSKALYGREPNLGELPTFSNKLSPNATTGVLDWTTHTELLCPWLAGAQDRFKRTSIASCAPFAISEQLAYKYFGLFTISERVGTLAYRLVLPPDIRTHPVFHVSQLKPFTPNYSPVFSELPKIPDLTALQFSPIAILECLLVKKGSAGVVHLRIQWSTLPTDATTWEDQDVLRLRYLDVVI